MNPTINTPMYKLIWADVKTFVHNARVRYAKRALDRAFRRAIKLSDNKHVSPDFFLECNGAYYTCTHSEEVIDVLRFIINKAVVAMKERDR